MIRLGLFLYDHLSSRNQLPGSRGLAIKADDPANPLQPEISFGFEYADCRVNDARLVVANALLAKEHGATILTRTRCQRAWRKQGLWHIALEDRDGRIHYARGRALVNACGPWAQRFIETATAACSPRTIRLIKGSHLVVPKLYEGDQAYILQNEDQRIVFVIPYLDDFTLIGTTDKLHQGDPGTVSMDADEETYLLDVVNRHFRRQLAGADILWRYSGVRPLCDDESSSPSAMTRDYTLEVEDDGEQRAPCLSVFGGKITTYRRLAESAMARLKPYFPQLPAGRTQSTPLAGANFGAMDFNQWRADLLTRYHWLPDDLLVRLSNAYGTGMETLLNQARHMQDLGRHFGGGLYAAEVDYLIREEWATCAEDVLWRRTKLGLRLNEEEARQLADYIAARLTELAPLMTPHEPQAERVAS
jgi:glycerol-3-phosphate dehydrogenase